jgi:hypothetical protein
MQNNMQFTSIGFKGGLSFNGIPVDSQGVTPRTIGGVFSTGAANDGYEAVFGVVVSALTSAPDQFLIGTGGGSGIVRGIVQFDAGIAQNAPSKRDYYLKGTPCTVGFEGTYRFNSWTKTAVGAAEPNIASKVIFKDTTGAIEFVDSGTAVPSGWTQLSSCKVIEVDPNGRNGIALLVRL